MLSQNHGEKRVKGVFHRYSNRQIYSRKCIIIWSLLKFFLHLIYGFRVCIFSLIVFFKSSCSKTKLFSHFLGVKSETILLSWWWEKKCSSSEVFPQLTYVFYFWLCIFIPLYKIFILYRYSSLIYFFLLKVISCNTCNTLKSQ